MILSYLRLITILILTCETIVNCQFSSLFVLNTVLLIQYVKNVYIYLVVIHKYNVTVLVIIISLIFLLFQILSAISADFNIMSILCDNNSTYAIILCLYIITFYLIQISYHFYVIINHIIYHALYHIM